MKSVIRRECLLCYNISKLEVAVSCLEGPHLHCQHANPPPTPAGLKIMNDEIYYCWSLPTQLNQLLGWDQAVDFQSEIISDQSNSTSTLRSSSSSWATSCQPAGPWCRLTLSLDCWCPGPAPLLGAQLLRH